MRRFQSKKKEIEKILNMYPLEADLRQAIERQRKICFQTSVNATRFNLDINIEKKAKTAVNEERLDTLMQLEVFHNQLLTYMMCALYGPEW